MLKFLLRIWNGGLSRLQLTLVRAMSGRNHLRYLDVGASAMTKPRVGLAFLETNVIAFDPDPRAEDDFKGHKFNVKYYPYALAGTSGQRKLYLTRKSHCSSLLKPLNTEDARYLVDQEIMVECRRLDDFEITADMVKIDAQGAELEILRNAQNTLAQIHVVELEVWFDRKYHDQARIDELHDFMQTQGFRAAGFSALYFDNQSNGSGIAFGDMLFVAQAVDTQNGKVVLAALIDAALDRLIPRFASPGFKSSSDRMLLRAIQAISFFKSSGPKEY